MQVQSSDVFLLPTRRLGPEPTFQDEIDKLRKEPWHTRPAFVERAAFAVLVRHA